MKYLGNATVLAFVGMSAQTRHKHKTEETVETSNMYNPLTRDAAGDAALVVDSVPPTKHHRKRHKRHAPVEGTFHDDASEGYEVTEDLVVSQVEHPAAILNDDVTVEDIKVEEKLKADEEKLKADEENLKADEE
ncbi:hypothetical protein ENBRE01_3340, partial [Enteropsectra breve]